MTNEKQNILTAISGKFYDKFFTNMSVSNNCSTTKL